MTAEILDGVKRGPVTHSPEAQEHYDRAHAKVRAIKSNTCPGCGCLVPANEEIKRCNVCGHDICDGCGTDNGWCQLCADIKEERNT